MTHIHIYVNINFSGVSSKAEFCTDIAETTERYRHLRPFSMIYNNPDTFLTLGLRVLASAIREQLTEDLRKPRYRHHPHPIRGHCYHATEAAYYLLGGSSNGWVPQRVRVRHYEGRSETHWYLRNMVTRVVFDITADQYDTQPNYETGKGCGFLTNFPSRSAKKIIDRIDDSQRHFHPYVPPAPR